MIVADHDRGHGQIGYSNGTKHNEDGPFDTLMRSSLDERQGHVVENGGLGVWKMGNKEIREVFRIG
jgi:hypothetical protein